MVIRQYPEDIKEMMDIYQQYIDRIHDGKLKDVPLEALEAFNKVKEWAWEQGQ